MVKDDPRAAFGVAARRDAHVFDGVSLGFAAMHAATPFQITLRECWFAPGSDGNTAAVGELLIDLVTRGQIGFIPSAVIESRPARTYGTVIISTRAQAQLDIISPKTKLRDGIHPD